MAKLCGGIPPEITFLQKGGPPEDYVQQPVEYPEGGTDPPTTSLCKF